MSETSRNLNFLGQSGYYFFFGWCEDRNDPEKLGRIKVRIAGIHTEDKTLLPTSSLPWSQVVLPTTVNDSSMVDIQEGTCVTGFFLDGEDMQVPIINGHLPGMIKGVKHYSGKTDKTLSNYADGRKIKKRTVLSAGKVAEPPNPYAGKYPFVHGFETESGHVVEYDDTAGAERLCVTHKSGSYIQIDKTGNVVIRSATSHAINSGDSNELCQNKIVHVSKNLDITVQGNANITVQGNAVEKISGTKTINASGQIQITSSANVTIKGAKISLN